MWLIERMARLLASEAWTEGLNPTQAAALQYLARANRFSRSPSHVADYLLATRGTVSQTLKALQQKGLIAEQRSDADRRSISYDLTDDGHALVKEYVTDSPTTFPVTDDLADAASENLSAVMQEWLTARNARPFGLCRNCQYHQVSGKKRHCALLAVDLAPSEADKICFEQQAAP